MNVLRKPAVRLNINSYETFRKDTESRRNTTQKNTALHLESTLTSEYQQKESAAEKKLINEIDGSIEGESAGESGTDPMNKILEAELMSNTIASTGTCCSSSVLAIETSKSTASTSSTTATASAASTPPESVSGLSMSLASTWFVSVVSLFVASSFV